MADNKPMIPHSKEVGFPKDGDSGYNSHYREDYGGFSQPPRKPAGFFTKLLLFLIIVLLAGLGGAFLWQRYVVDKGYQTQNAQEVIKNQENPALKADKLDPSKVYVLSGASDTLNNCTITIEKVQFRKDQTRLWVKFENTGSRKIEMMPNITTMLVDDKGNQYKVDPFAGQLHLNNGLAPGASESAMLSFPPIKAEAKKINFNLNMVFNLKDPAWSYQIPVDIP